MAQQFLVLHRCRAAGFSGPQPIAIGEVAAYMQFFPQLDELKFLETIMATDSYYCSHVYEEGKKPKKHS